MLDLCSPPAMHPLSVQEAGQGVAYHGSSRLDRWLLVKRLAHLGHVDEGAQFLRCQVIVSLPGQILLLNLDTHTDLSVSLLQGDAAESVNMCVSRHDC